MPVDDRPLIEGILRGNTRDFTLLVRRYQDRSMTLALRLLGNRAEAEELVQDAFMRVYRNLSRFRGEAAFHTWLYRIVYNLCLSKISRRREKPGEPIAEELSPAAAEFSGTGELSVQEAVELAEQKEIVRQEIGNLPFNYRTAVTLFYLQEMTYEEIGAVMEIPIGTVKTYLYRGRVSLSRRVVARCHHGADAA